MSNIEHPPEGSASAPRVSFFTLGCRLNQHDTAAMRRDLEGAGWCAGEGGAGDRGDGDADVIVVNTCTVTRRADQESRQLIRRLARERPGRRIVVTGCYAQRAPEEVRGLPGVSMVLGTAERESIAVRLEAMRVAVRPRGETANASGGAASPIAVQVAPGRMRRAASASESAPLHLGRARALLKVQDGCDGFCEYCIVPYVRGRSRSVPRAALLAQARALLTAGFRELVLTGADLGDYDGGAAPAGESVRTPRTEGALAALVETVLALPASGAPHRVRLSSIEPHKVDGPLLDLLATEPRLCRHLHLPLQSGSTSVLRAMRRAYAPCDYAALVERAAAAGPIAIGADVIVGFPGEGEREFEETERFLASLPVAYLHVFRYSERPGTRAALRGGSAAQPAETAVVRERAERLRALGESKRLEFERSLIGTMRGVVLEARRGPAGEWLGTSDLYATIALPSRPADPGPTPVRVTEQRAGLLRGTTIEPGPER